MIKANSPTCVSENPDRQPQRLTGDQYAEGSEGGLPDQYDKGQQNDGSEIFCQHGRFDHHPHRDEEDRSEEVLDRFDQSCDPFGCDRFGHEGSQCRRKTGFDGNHHHAQTESERHDEQHFVVEQALQPFEQGGDQVDSQYRPEDEEHAEFEDAAQHLGAFELLAHGQRRKQNQQDDADQILDDKYSQYDTRKPLTAQSHVVEGLEDDGCR